MGKKSMGRGQDRFFVTEYHLKLLDLACVEFNDELDVPSFDCKRPYGDKRVSNAIVDLCGWMKDEHGDPTNDALDLAWQMQKDMAFVLAILVRNHKTGISPGYYYRPDPFLFMRWERDPNQDAEVSPL